MKEPEREKTGLKVASKGENRTEGSKGKNRAEGSQKKRKQD